MDNKKNEEFITEMTELLNFSCEIYKYNSEGKEISEGDLNTNLTNLIKYKNFYLGTEKQPNGTKNNPIHYNQMCSVYKKCIEMIISVDDIQKFQDWLTTANLMLKIPVTNSRKTLNFTFPITTIFNHSIKIADHIIENKIKSKKLEVYPDIFTYYFLRVLVKCSDNEEEIRNINILISELKDFLKPQKNGSLSYKEKSGESNFDLDVMNLAKEFMQEMNIEVPKEELEDFNLKDFRENISTVIKNPQMKSIFKDVMGSVNLKDPAPEDLGTIFSNISEGFKKSLSIVPDGILEARQAKASTS